MPCVPTPAPNTIPGSLVAMPPIETHQTDTAKSRPAAHLPSGARIDTAHAVGDADEASASEEAFGASTVAGTATQPSDDLSEQLRLQGEQLAAALQRRRNELDRREARLNARNAEQENEARGLRMWLVERQQDLDEREAGLKRRERDVEDRCSQLIAAESFQESSQSEAQRYAQRHQALLDRRLGDLDQRERDLTTREAALETTNAELQQSRQQLDDNARWQRQQIDARREASLQLIRLGLEGLERRRQAIEQQAVETEALRKRLLAENSEQAAVPVERLRDLERRERLVEEGFELIDLRRTAQQDLEQQLEERADAQLRHTRRDQQQRIAREQQLKLRHEQTQKKFKHRESELDARQTALDQLRESLASAQRESLELRLATEELWNQLLPKFPAPALTASLGQIRARLADHDRLTRQELVEHRQKLEALRDQLVSEHARLDTKKRDHQAWVERRTQDLDQRTQALATRQFKLDEIQNATEHLQHDWCRERLALQDQVQSLMRQVREQIAGT